MKPFGIIGRKLLLWFVLVAIVPLTVVGLRSLNLARQAVMRETFLHMEAVAGYKQDQVENWLLERSADLNLLASDPRIRNRNPGDLERQQEMQAWLRIWRENTVGFDRVEVVNSEGRVELAVGSPQLIHPDGSAASPAEWAQAATNAGISRFSPVEYHPELGTWMEIALPVASAMGQPAGWVVGRVTLSRSLDPMLLDSTGLGRTGQTYLVDARQIMLTRSRFMDHPEPGTHRMHSAAIDSALAGREGSGIYTGWEGEPVLGAWRYLPAANWALIGEMSQAEALAEVGELQRNWLVISAVTLVAAFIVVAVITRSLSHPILRLADAARRISRGDLGALTGIRRSDEIGTLAQSFDQMAAALAVSRQYLERSYQDLIAAERRLVQSEKLAAIGELVASVVHELRNPLSSIKMNLKMLARKLPAEGTVSESLSIAQDQVLRLERMLTQILDYAKPVALNPVPSDLRDLLRQALESQGELVESAGVQVEWDVPDGLPPVTVDQELMGQALINLVRNAVQAMAPSGGKLRLSARVADSRELVLEIADTGPGISEAQRERMFEPFYTTRLVGTGLGLPNARKAVELHRGRLEVAGREGDGTTARIIIPLGNGHA
ncbi:MAG: HAMP domain-containing protein [Candidatus Zixiibacteriota bacterium]|nr:MAG: HAMP domain-containing protein [candidate division Zixibacteria bacterium]